MQDPIERLRAGLAERYRIERELGRGGMANVYLADDLKHDRLVAIKVLLPELGLALGGERFLREIRTAASLTHPHIVPLYDSGEVDGLLYYVMPYVEGESLRGRLEREKQLSIEEALRITREVAEALEHAHRSGVVHRDIKPENVLLESGHAVVTDFGLAKAVEGASSQRLTVTGMIVGTPAYMSPEQVAGSPEVDARSDQYALATLLYELLAGAPPFTARTYASLRHQLQHVAPRPVTELRPSVPVGVSRAIQRALSKAPADRYASVSAFAAALGEGVPGDRGSRPVALALGALALAALGAYGVLAWWHRPVPAPARKEWILVADFEAPPGDSTLAPAVRSLLSAALDQSRFVATVTREQVNAALEAAGRPANVPLTPELARELAYRSAVRVVLEGSIGRIGNRYSIVLRAVSADSGRVIVAADGTAKTADGLIPAVGELGKRMRRGLGENGRAIAATRPMALVATPSFEAYRLYVQGVECTKRGENARTLGLCRSALALDPDFANAWGAMTFAYWNRGYPDSTLLACDEALKRSNRLTATQRLRYENLRRSVTGDEQGALDAIDRTLLDDPNDLWALGVGNDMLWDFGRFEDALARMQQYERLAPFGPSDNVFINESHSLTFLGRFDEARQVAERIKGYLRPHLIAWADLGEGRFAAAESIGVSLAGDPRTRMEYPAAPARFTGLARAGRGALRQADSCLAVAESLGAGQFGSTRSGMLLALMNDQPLPAWHPDARRDTTAMALLARALREAFGGDTVLARRCLVRVQTRPASQRMWEGAQAELARAGLDGRRGRWDQVVSGLQPLAVLRVVPHWAGYEEMSWIRWYLADAYEKLGRPDSAAAQIERITADPRAQSAVPYAHLRLAALDARLGRGDDARRHLALAQQALTTPDPELRRRIERVHAMIAATG